MSELELEVIAGPTRVISVPVTAVDILLINGPLELVGWSLRDATADVPLETEGNVTSPGALATICSIANVPAGTYNVNWEVQLAGAAAAADANNFQLVSGATGLVQSVNQGAVGNYPQEPVEITIAATATVKIVAIAAGTVGAIYSAQLTLIPVTSVNSVVELQDGNNPLAEIAVPNPGVDTRWFGSGGLKVRNRVNLHVVSGAVTGAIYGRFDKTTG